ncbi:PucR family transcriptional regulator [Streptosporangium sp. NBC_01756]|uniref:PucR family transcriptional regulator n=1 Tax=Streptosporangium sp. NBC_01756 TaxID=2975950 RepID=UPI002DDBACD2|nr:PucR family transcriptional regulator ligand-binding domain-containing protein [Streptosporangium sp. NBC_01756]WSC84808.1 PucR family transcriptional regulator ligand-binding domain-containing protein [Streptosporangium sp. NBC_01756]
MRIRDLVGMAELGLTLLAGEEQLDRDFSGVQITDLPDPGRYLSGGELVLSGLMWRNGPEDSERFVGRLAEAGVAALGAGSAWLGTVPEDLVRACRAYGLPLLAVPVEVSFRTVAELVAPRHAELRDALGRHRRIVAAVAEGAGLPELFALMGTELAMEGAVVSAVGTVIAGTLDQADAVRLAHGYLTAPRLPHVVHAPSGTFTLFGVGREHRAAGWALACGGDLLGEADLGFELAACVALERSRAEEGRRVERRLAEQLIALACSAGGDPAELNAGLRTCGIGPAEPYSVVNVTVTRPGATRGPDPARLGGQVLEELLHPRVVAAAGADGAVALVPLAPPSAPAGEPIGTVGKSTGTVGEPIGAAGVPAGTAGELAERLRAGARVLTAGLPGIRVSIGVSAALRGPSAVRGGVAEAGHARRLAEARGGAVVTSDEIYTHALLLATVPDDVRRSFAARTLDPLFDYDRRHGSELVRTLGTFLDCVGSWNTCAERMNVHVNTVRYRIRRVEELTGRDLSTMTDRVDLFLALRGS